MAATPGNRDDYVRKIVKEELDAFCDGKLKQILNKFTEDMIVKLKIVEKNINTRMDDKEKANSGKQLALINQNIKSEVMSTINSNLLPRIRQLTNLVEEKTLDESLLLRDYRDQVMGIYNPDVKQLTMSGTAEENAEAFRKSMFVFNDDD